MHLLRTESRSLDEAEAAIDLAQTPADLVFLSFSDSDLGAVAAAAQMRAASSMSLRLANIAQLKHPFSVDLYVEKVAAKARFVLIRLLGGLDYWRYGVEEFSRAAREHCFALAIVPGDAMGDPRLEAASTLPAEDLGRIFARFQDGGAENIGAILDWIEGRMRAPIGFPPLTWPAQQTLPPAGVFQEGCRRSASAKGRALILFYRSYLLADDTAPVIALAEGLAARGLEVQAIFVTSLDRGRQHEQGRTEEGARLPLYRCFLGNERCARRKVRVPNRHLNGGWGFAVAAKPPFACRPPLVIPILSSRSKR